MRLDLNRTIAQIAKKVNTNISSIEGVIVWGNHSHSQFPDYTFAKVEGKPLKELVNLKWL